MSGVVRIYQHGGPEVLTYEQRTLDRPGQGHVTLAQDYIGVNFVDTMFRDGTFPLAQFPAVLGMEAAGTVTAAGPGVRRWKEGDRVAYWTDMGAYAEQRHINADALVHIPDDVSTSSATAVLTKGLLAWALTHLIAPIKHGDTVVVGPAAGGVGSILVRWAKALGANVIATVGNEAKAALVRQAGIQQVVVSAEPGDAADDISDLVGARGVNTLYDGVGGDGFARLWPLVAEGGTAVLFGGAAGYPAVNSKQIARQGVRFVQPSTGQYVNTPELAETGAAAVFDELRKGTFGVVTPTLYALADARQAHADLGARRTSGSLLLTTSV